MEQLELFPKRVRKKCSTCGSTAVYHDAWAEWSEENQEWVLGTIYDYIHCDVCEGETSIAEEQIL